MNFELSGPIGEIDGSLFRPWRKLPFWQWRIEREGFQFWIVKSRPVNAAEFREVILWYRGLPPKHFNCQATVIYGDGIE